jgi:uncharacterized protein (DUF362 family)
VFVVSAPPAYRTSIDGPVAPELPSGVVTDTGTLVVRELFRQWGLDAAAYGSPSWNPLGELIPAGARVLLKPNWVLHRNLAGHGLECLVTNTQIIEAVVEYVLLARPAAIAIGDAPIQGCDFDALQRDAGVTAMVERFARRGVTITIADFRRTVLPHNDVSETQLENRRDTGEYVLFDVGRASLLEPLSRESDRFRVTMYNPDLLHSRHAAGRHQYLIAREAIDADVVINLPKLKAHKKACVTGALKNLVGINGNKEFLPHHRTGGPGSGGDCYATDSPLKSWAERLLDWANRRNGGTARRAAFELSTRLADCARLTGADADLEGSWYGNDTIWRTCLDLQRILHYGTLDGTLADTPQRVVLHITDAIVGGENDGPLAPEPVPSGFITGALNAAAAEWVNARLMGFDPILIPLVREAFRRFDHPLCAFDPSDIRVHTDHGILTASELRPPHGRPFLAPRGWRGHCELDTPYVSSDSHHAVVA